MKDYSNLYAADLSAAYDRMYEAAHRRAVNMVGQAVGEANKAVGLWGMEEPLFTANAAMTAIVRDRLFAEARGKFISRLIGEE